LKIIIELQVAQTKARFRALVNLYVEEHLGYNISRVYGNKLQ